MAKRLKGRRKNEDIYEFYRRTFDMPHLTDKEIDEMRPHLQRLARAICEHVWGEKFY